MLAMSVTPVVREHRWFEDENVSVTLYFYYSQLHISECRLPSTLAHCGAS